MSVTQTFTVTVANPGSGNRYYIDGVLQDTVTLIEGKTYRFDQSDSSNSSHPLRFSTTSDGTHGGGSEYTTGVTTNGTPGQSGAYTEITVASSAPTLYYYCTNHSGMGGQANTPDPHSSITYTLTVQSVDGVNKYFIDGVQQDTLFLERGNTYTFDDSDSSVSGHPLAFSITPDGTHNGGTYYNTGTSRNNSPGQPGAYVRIVVADDAPDQLYYFCQNHSGMGGSMHLSDTFSWGEFSWGDNTWQSGVVLQSLTGQSATSSVGDGTNMGVPQTGFGGQTWSTGEWGQVNDNSVVLTGFGLTTSLNADGLLSFQSAGWGRNTWNDGPYGESNDPVVSITGFGLTSSVGDGTNMGVPQQGWGGKSWGDNNYGELSNIDVFPSGLSATTSIGSVTVSAEINTGWGRAAWNDDAWGIQGDILLDGQSATASVGSLSPADVLSPSGQSATVSLGDPTIIGNVTLTLTGQSSTTSLGTVNIIEGIGLDGQSATASVGSLSPADIMGVTGLSTTASLGDIETSSNPVIILSGFGLSSSNGSLDPADQVMGVTGQSATSSVGTGLSISSTFDIELTGLSATTSVAAFGTSTGFGIQAFSDVDTGSNSSYTDVATGSNTSYTDAA